MSDGGFLGGQPEVVKTPEAPSVPPQEVSSVEADEQTRERLPEISDAFLEEAPEMPAAPQEAAAGTEKPAGVAAVAPAVVKDEVMIEVEKILGEDLGDYFQQLPEEAKARFREKGEEVAGQVADMVRNFRVKVKKVLQLVRDWLLTLPGVNKFFLEQEAKIKTDRVIELERSRREEAQKLP